MNLCPDPSPPSSSPSTPNRPRRLTEEELDALAAILPATIKRYDRNLRCIYLSPGSERFTAKPVSWFIGRCLDDYEGYPEEFISSIKNSIQSILATGELRRLETSLPQPWGITRRVHHQSPEYGPDGEIVSVLSISFDITEKHNNHVRLQQTLAEQSNFLAMLAHELRNPLAAVLSGLQALDREPKASDSKLIRGIMHKELTHITRLIEDLLDTARIETGTLKYHKRACSLGECLSLASEIVRPVLKNAEQSLIPPVDQLDIPLFADTTRIAQALSNLLHNASKFSPRGSTITVRHFVGKDIVQIDVVDQGIGVSPTGREKIFDRYAQDEKEHDSHSSGLGLGLFVSREILLEHGGNISLESSDEQGSVFRITLPIHIAHEKPSHETPLTPSLTQATTILLVDDNSAALEAMKLLFELDGHTVFTATSGSQGAQLYTEHRPIVVVLDIGLPDVTGHQVAQHLRQFPRVDRPLLIALTGRGTESDRKVSLSSGFDAHLIKPANVDEISKLISGHLAKVA